MAVKRSTARKPTDSTGGGNFDPKKIRRLLEEERAGLEELLHTRQQESLGETEQETFQELSSYDQHNADMGTETFERMKAESIKISVEDRLNDVEHAMHRLDKGSYGKCEACGRPIPKARLEALPATRYCAEDAGKIESGGAPT